MSEHGIKYGQIEISKLKKSDWNPNKMDPDEFNLLCENLEEVGCIDPIQVIDDGDGSYEILGGHHRRDAAEVLGWKTIPCVILERADWNVDKQKFQNVRLNVIKGKLNPEKFINLYKEMVKSYGQESMQRLMGFTDKDKFLKLIGQVRKGMANAGIPQELRDQFGKAADEIKTVDGLSTVLNTLFTKFGNTLDVGFMVFDYGGVDNIYVRLEGDVKKKVWKLKDHCYEKQVHIDNVFRRIFESVNINEIMQFTLDSKKTSDNEDPK